MNSTCSVHTFETNKALYCGRHLLWNRDGHQWWSTVKGIHSHYNHKCTFLRNIPLLCLGIQHLPSLHPQQLALTSQQLCLWCQYSVACGTLRSCSNDQQTFSIYIVMAIFKPCRMYPWPMIPRLHMWVYCDGRTPAHVNPCTILFWCTQWNTDYTLNIYL